MFVNGHETPRVIKIEIRPPLPRVSSVSMPRCFRKMLPADGLLESSFRTHEDEVRVSPKCLGSGTESGGSGETDRTRVDERSQQVH
jgi:hypothetical protein